MKFSVRKILLSEISKCSNCGKCHTPCKIYNLFLQEHYSARGKINIIKTLLEGKIKYNNKIDNLLNTCLFCNKCSNTCPVGLDFNIIFTFTKALFKNKIYNVNLPDLKSAKTNHSKSSKSQKKFLLIINKDKGSYKIVNRIIRFLQSKKIQTEIIEYDNAKGIKYFIDGKIKYFLKFLLQNFEKIYRLPAHKYIFLSPISFYFQKKLFEYFSPGVYLHKIEFFPEYLINKKFISIRKNQVFHLPCYFTFDAHTKIDYCCGFFLKFLKPKDKNKIKSFLIKNFPEFNKSIIFPCLDCYFQFKNLFKGEKFHYITELFI